MPASHWFAARGSASDWLAALIHPPGPGPELTESESDASLSARLSHGATELISNHRIKPVFAGIRQEREEPVFANGLRVNSRWFLSPVPIFHCGKLYPGSERRAILIKPRDKDNYGI